MANDITAKIKEYADKIMGDKDLLAKFKKDPVKTLEGLLGVDLPDEQVKALVEGIKAKIGISSASEKAKGVADLLGGLLGKKK